jgi:hypothetical protein
MNKIQMSVSNDIQELIKYVNKQGLRDVFSLLIYQIKLSEARSHFIRETYESLRLPMSADKSSSSNNVIKGQIIQLDLISKLFMFMEDYLSYSYYLHNAKEELPTKILSHDSVVWKEIEHLKSLDNDGIYKYLLLPNSDNLPLSHDDREFVKETLSNLVRDILGRIKEITNFYDKYNRIYIKYKHIFSALIGTSYKDEKNRIEIPRIFMRDINKDKTICTYILSTDNETVDYYGKLGNDTSKVFSILLDCHIHSIQNFGRAFLIPDIDFTSSHNKDKWLEIVRKVNTFTGIPPLTLTINVMEPISQLMLKGLAKDHIFKSNRDIFSTSNTETR